MASAKKKPAASPRSAAGAFSRAEPRSQTREQCRRGLADHDFADLYHRSDIGVVLDIAHDLLAMLGHARLKGIKRVDKDMAHADIGRGCAGSTAGDALVHGV